MHVGLLAVSMEAKAEGGAGGEVVRACLLDRFDGSHRLAGWLEWHSPPSAQNAADPSPIHQAVAALGEGLGRELWDAEQNRPILESRDPVRRPPLGQVALLATSLPRLGVWLAGLTDPSLDVAAQAVASGPARLLGRTRLTRHSHPTQITEMLIGHRPQVLLILGGQDRTDPSAQAPVLALCNLIGRGLEAVPPSQRPILLYAGSAPAQAQALALLAQAGGPVRVLGIDNLQPEPGVRRLAPVAQTLHRLYGALNQRQAGIQRVARWNIGAGTVEGVDWGFVRLVRLWAEARELPHLHGLYCGPSGWLHAWVERSPEMRMASSLAGSSRPDAKVRLIYAEAGTRPPILAGWPPVQLVCGAWPEALWPRTPGGWHDVRSLAPAVAALAQTEPDAALQVLSQDLLEEIKF